MLALGLKDLVLDKFNIKKLLAETGILLPFKVPTLKYVQSCCKQRVPRHLLMTKLTKSYLNKHDLLVARFERGTVMSVMKCGKFKAKPNP